MSLKTPVLFLIFNRPDTAQKVFDSIRNVRPKKLYVASDSPRPNHPEDISKCIECKNILKQIDWDCDLHTRFLDVNLGGCDNALRSEISWFFENENEGIILEDDIVANTDFFYFCDEMLDRYREKKEIMLISGSNLVSNKQNISDFDYYYSRVTETWGWATWKDRWQLLDQKLCGSTQFLKAWFKDPYFKKAHAYQETFGHIVEYYSQHPLDMPWDYQMAYTMNNLHKLCILPRVNLATNIGQFGYHYNDISKKSKYLYIPTESLDTRCLRSPKEILPNQFLDRIYFNYSISQNWYGRPGRTLLYLLRRMHINIYVILVKLKIVPF